MGPWVLINANWYYMDRFAGVIQIDVTATEFILSPAYDLGLTEAELREANLAHLQNLS